MKDDLDTIARRALHEDDREAWTQLVDESWPSLIGVARQVLFRQEDAEDAVQQALLKIWNHRKKYWGHFFSKWAAQITWRTGRDVARKLLGRQHNEESAGEFLDTQACSGLRPEEVIARADNQAAIGLRLTECLQALSRRQREAFSLYYGELGGDSSPGQSCAEHTIRDVATILGIAPASAQGLIDRAKVKLYDCLGGDFWIEFA